MLGCKRDTKPIAEAGVAKEEIFKGFSSKLKQFKFQGKQDTTLLNRNKALLDVFFRQQWLANKVSAGLLVAKNGEIIYENYTGLANRETGDSINATTPIHLASISKVMTAMFVLKMVEEGLFDLDDKVADYLVGFPYHDVTIRHLLNHRSGLRNYTYLADDESYWNKSKYLTNDDVLAIFKTHKPKLNYSAGTRFSYSNTNYVFLALLIEKVLEMDFKTAMSKYLFEPFGMDNTFVFQLKDTARVSQSYTYYYRRFPFNHLDVTYGDKNIYSTPRDLLKFDRATYSPDFLSEELKQQAFKGYSYEVEGVKNYGLGYRMMEWPEGQKVLYHNGWWHGNFTSYVRAFQDSVTIIALGNRKQRAVYSAFSIIGLFGNYPMEVEGVDEIVKPRKDSLLVQIDSIEARQDKKSLPVQPKPIAKKNSQSNQVKKDSLKSDSLKSDSSKDSILKTKPKIKSDSE